MAVSMKFGVFWDVAPCGHIEVDRHFGGFYSVVPEASSAIRSFLLYSKLYAMVSMVTLPSIILQANNALSKLY
jgi:hypothetical protein